MELIDTAKKHVKEIKVSGLPGLVELVKSEAILYASSDDPLFVEIVDPCYVRVFGSLDRDLDRTVWYSAAADDVPGFRSGYRTYEEFVIELRSRFVPNEGIDYLLDLFSRMDISEKSTSEGWRVRWSSSSTMSICGAVSSRGQSVSSSSSMNGSPCR